MPRANTLTITSPNKGEQWKQGQGYDIKWKLGKNIRNYGVVGTHVYLEDHSGNPRCSSGKACGKWKFLGYHRYVSKGIFWKVPESYALGSKYKIFVIVHLRDGNLYYDRSDDFFSIVSPSEPEEPEEPEEEQEEEETCHTSPLWSWNYCATNCKCYAGEGDCDSNDDCHTGYCAFDVGEKYGQDSRIDVCEEKEQKEQKVYNFTQDLCYGDTRYDHRTQIIELKQCLKDQGFYKGLINWNFDSETSKAVIAFQEQYADEILASLGVRHGHGYVGRRTRDKLNEVCNK